MSIPVEIERLAEALTDFTFAYLITVGDDFRAHAVAVDPLLGDGRFTIDSVGRTTRRNASAHANVTLVWPPSSPGGYSLIVDGRGSCASDDAPLMVVPGRAVLHRPAVPGVPTASGCGDDCVPL
ncbi:hypothetical protein [Mycobacterium sp. M26]|uniref:hypothetical protein n=1 Tax=Mycobacterium sp. M26 TaxID=1762962 RepID=UPI00073E319B|nr:hypothetical protein [Mycobacterium sp. M26]